MAPEDAATESVEHESVVEVEPIETPTAPAPEPEVATSVSSDKKRQQLAAARNAKRAKAETELSQTRQAELAHAKEMQRILKENLQLKKEIAETTQAEKPPPSSSDSTQHLQAAATQIEKDQPKNKLITRSQLLRSFGM